jgi:hypothetical protein
MKMTIPICAMILKFLILSAGILVKSISFVGSADLSFWRNVSLKVLFIENVEVRSAIYLGRFTLPTLLYTSSNTLLLS